jgi:hypothetical protein
MRYCRIGRRYFTKDLQFGFWGWFSETITIIEGIRILVSSGARLFSSRSAWARTSRDGLRDGVTRKWGDLRTDGEMAGNGDGEENQIG